MRLVCFSALPILCAATAACATGGAAPPMERDSDATEVSSIRLAEGENFAVFRGDGERVALDDVMAEAASVDVVLLGEEHDDRMAHRLQLEVFRRAFAAPSAGDLPEGHPPARAGAASGRPLVLSLEMFERDVQGVLDEYLAGLITEEHLRASARPWGNYVPDYRPLVEFAKTHGVPVVAANAPRRYVNRASRLGRDSLLALPAEALATLPPLPYPEPTSRYRAQWDSLMGPAAGHGGPAMPATVLDGQTLWDASMAHSIARALGDRPGALVVHLAGSFHVERGTGIPEALAHYRPGVRVLAVVFKSTEELDFDPARHAGYGDFVILTDEAFKRGSG